jgi:rhamnosyltransferase
VNVISVVIPTKDAGPGFRETLEAVFAQQIDGQIEVVVVDSGSVDGTVALSQEFPLRLVQIPPQDYGHGRTRNLGIAEAKGEWVALLVQDALPADQSWLRHLISPLQSDHLVAGAFSRQMPRPGADYVSRTVAHHWHRLVGGRTVLEITDWEDFQQQDAEQKLSCCAFNNVSSLVRRSVWQQIPLPDVAYAEDVAWALQVLRSGYRLVYEPASVVVHSHQRSWRQDLQRAYLDGLTLAEMFDSEMPLPSPTEVQRTLRLAEQECLAAPPARWDPTEMPAPVEQAREWYRRRFTSRSVAHLLSSHSSWQVNRDDTRVGALCRFLDWQDLRPRQGIRPFPGLTTLRRLWTILRRVWLRLATAALGQLPIPSRLRDRVFCAFWQGLGWRHLQQAVMQVNGEHSEGLLERVAAIDYWQSVVSMADHAVREGVALSPNLLGRIRCHAAATELGKWLGRAGHACLRAGQLHGPVAEIHAALMSGDDLWYPASRSS